MFHSSRRFEQWYYPVSRLSRAKTTRAEARKRSLTISPKQLEGDLRKVQTFWDLIMVARMTKVRHLESRASRLS